MTGTSSAPNFPARTPQNGVAIMRNDAPVMPASVSDIHNYRQPAPNLATSGQPREAELQAIADAGYEVIVNLALHDDPRYSLTDEASCVKALGLDYIHIPVQFGAPSGSDLVRFF